MPWIGAPLKILTVWGLTPRKTVLYRFWPNLTISMGVRRAGRMSRQMQERGHAQIRNRDEVACCAGPLAARSAYFSKLFVASAKAFQRWSLIPRATSSKRSLVVMAHFMNGISLQREAQFSQARRLKLACSGLCCTRAAALTAFKDSFSCPRALQRRVLQPVHCVDLRLTPGWRVAGPTSGA